MQPAQYQVNIKTMDIPVPVESVVGLLTNGDAHRILGGDAFVVVALDKTNVNISVTGADKENILKLLQRLYDAIPKLAEKLREGESKKDPPTAVPAQQKMVKKIPMPTESLVKMLTARGFNVSKKDGE